MNTKLYLEACENARTLAYEAEAYIWKHPETGYREWNTEAYLAERFEKLGYTLTKAGDIPGFYTDIDTGKPGPKILIFGELDSLICFDHPDAASGTGAVHACGHHCQAAVLLGLAAALKEPGVLEGLSGSVRLCAVPAEELIETGWRETLREKGTIKYYGGKVEFLYRGYLDRCDICYMVHTSGGDKRFVGVSDGGNGCVVKNTIFKGKASHAGGSPESGINALYAANVAFTATNALRETFWDDKHIRFHPIVTKGGEAVNAIPSEVVTESYVRGSDIESISEVNKKINRAFAGAALAMGGNVRLMDRVGYFPLNNSKSLSKLGMEALSEFMEEGQYAMTGGWDTGCTDMGDITAVMPAAHFYCAGAAGIGHGNNYHIENREWALMDSMRFQLILLAKLLENDAEKAKEVMETTELRYKSKEEYFAAVDANVCDLDAVEYAEDGIKIHLN